VSSVPPQMTKFPVKVYTMNGLGYDSTHDYYDMTEEELENKCCILECRIYFKDTVCNSYKCLIDQPFVDLYDIWNYECTPWWEWPQELKEVMYKKVPQSKPVSQTA